MFKQNEYIVCLEGDFTIDGDKDSSVARINYCVKQQYSMPHLAVFCGIDCNDSRSNIDFSFDKSKKLINWRYANQVEIHHYDKIGKPYDVTTLIKEKPIIEDHKELIKLLKKI